MVYLWGNKIEKGKMKEKENLTDVQNPAHLFQTIGSDILCAIVNSKIDAVQLAREELANRGRNHSGQWVGFDEAEKIAKGGVK